MYQATVLTKSSLLIIQLPGSPRPPGGLKFILFFPFASTLAATVADPGGFYPNSDPTRKKDPDTVSTLEKNPNPTVKKKNVFSQFYMQEVVSHFI